MLQRSLSSKDRGLLKVLMSTTSGNNETERQVRMVKVQQKTSLVFRTTAGATSWLANRNYLATVMKNGENPLEYAYGV